MKEKKLKTGKLTRALKLGKSITKIGVRAAADKIQGKKNLTESQIKSAKELINTMGELKGGLMKVGQMISVTGNTVLPEEVSQLFASLQNSSSFMLDSQLNDCFLKEFGKLPEDLFESFERKPFAAASIGQVHKAKLKTGMEVAVKVQYPDIEKAIEDDLQNLDKLEVLFDILNVPKPQMEDAFKELKRSLILECDYVNEKNAMESIKVDLQARFPQVHIPSVYPELSTKRILTTEFVSGDNFNETLNYSQKERDELGRLLFESFLFCLYHCKHLHTDPQNGNYLFSKGKIYLFDFGSTRTFDDGFVEDYALLQYAVEKKDVELYRKVGMSLSIIQEEDLYDFIEEHMLLVDKIYGPYLQEGSYFAKTPNPFGLVKEFISNMNFKNRPTPREEFMLLDRANVGLFMKLQTWQSRVNWREALDKYRSEALERAKNRYGV